MEYDYIIIGGGLGGYPAAIELSRNGYKVALIEKHKLGGECTNYGCIPTKAFIHFARTFHEGNKLPGLRTEITNYREMRLWRDSIIKRLVEGISFLLEKYGVETIQGEAILKNPHGEVIVNAEKERKELKAEKILIATGTRPFIPKGFNVDGKRVHDNRTLLSIDRIPKSIIIIGGGAIGVEYANTFALLGTDVTLIELMPQILPGMDPECVRWVSRNLRKLKVKVYTKTFITELKTNENIVEANTNKGMSVSAEYALIATGRVPNTNGLGLENAGVKTDEKGYIIVDETLKTSNPRIYAAGDVAGPPLLAHKAYTQSLVAARNMMGENVKFDHLIPYVVFSTPEIACTGMTEEVAKDKGISYKTVKFYYTALSRAHIESDGEGFIKILFNEESKRIIGTHIYGPYASEIISEFTLAMEKGISVNDIADVIHPHPTMSEAVKEVAELALDRPIHVYLKK